MKLEKGDRVKILDTQKLREWGNWKEAVGQIATVTYVGETSYLLDDNKYMINFTDESLKLVKHYRKEKHMKLSYEKFVEIAEKHGAGAKVVVHLADGSKVPAALQREKTRWYLCQNVSEGASVPNKLGYTYSWLVTSFSDLQLKGENIERIEVMHKGKALSPKYVLTYDRVDRDPYEVFFTDKELTDWIEAASKDKNIIMNSIVVYDIAKVRKVGFTWKLK